LKKQFSHETLETPAKPLFFTSKNAGELRHLPTAPRKQRTFLSLRKKAKTQGDGDLDRRGDHETNFL